MRFTSLLALAALASAGTVSHAQERGLAPARPKAPADRKTRLICKTGSENRAPGQPLKLSFQYNIPLQFEPEDPTQPDARQTVTFAGRPRVQLSFEKSPVAAGEKGENLAPMQCAFAKRPVSAREPAKVQILVQAGELLWLSQAMGQSSAGGQDRTLLTPGPEWNFTYQYDKVFALDLDDAEEFITGQKPRLLAPGA